MTTILDEIYKYIPKELISDAGFEGANIVLYTKDKDFFLDNEGKIREVVNAIKKRVELRPDPSITMEMEEAEKIIRSLIPEEAEVSNVIFDSQRSRVIIETSKPGVAIGKQGSTLREIRSKTFWVPLIRRTPAIRSKIIENIRAVLYQHSDERRKFLNQVGHRIYDGWIRGKKNEWVRISYLGSGRQVGRSAILLQTPESRVLLDCGIDIAASGKDAYPMLEAPEFRIDELDAVIISHAHLDHSGLVPYLFKFGYKGPVYCTPPTRDVMALLQLDLVKIMRGEGKDPLYTSDEVKQMVLHTITVDYEEVTDITPDVRITFYNAGHILGSAMVHMHIGNGLHNFLYTGDMKFGKTSLLEPAHTKFPRLESMTLEATYGGKDNTLPSKQESDSYLGELIKMTVERGGKVLIPVLGVGRAQEVLLIVEDLVNKGQIPPVPVYIDGMVWDVTAIHTAYPEYLNSKVRKSIFHKNENPFLNDIFKRVGSQKERKQVLEEEGSCVILATSGMLTGGPSVEYLKGLASFSKNTLIFVSYQGEGSLGRRIQRGEKAIAFQHGTRQEIVEINMEIYTVEGFSGHSGRRQLMSFAGKVNPRPKKIIINHGENSRCLDLASSLHKAYKVETVAPRNLEAIRLK
ncbi:beta-CASP ribonuclease aCPSF1 [Candidatus Woesearchaeota archaeon]|nr:MAG: beta-CASP ribonuclease aCPSF1 [Candidatus Woesearchaeota archaeon]